MNQERRQQELQRYLVMFETDLQKEKKGKQGETKCNAQNMQIDTKHASHYSIKLSKIRNYCIPSYQCYIVPFCSGLESLAAIYDKNANFTDPESKSTVYGKLRDVKLLIIFTNV